MSIAAIDVHDAVTSKIIVALEQGAGEFQLPWITRPGGGSLSRPVNVASGASYNGVNVLMLWVEALERGFSSNVWGTYRQWQARGCQVRKGETSSLIVFYKALAEAPEDEPDEETPRRRVLARASRVFNACQVEGFEPDEEPAASGPGFAPLHQVEMFVRGTGARIIEGGDMACFDPKADVVHMPERSAFIGSASLLPAESYYATLSHELVHWSGAKSRLDRDLSGRFGSDAYAMEELVAELGAAFLCADLGLSPEPRRDHAAYIHSWLKVLKGDKRAIFSAASKASQAASWLQDLAAP